MAGIKITDLESLVNASDSDFLIIIDRSSLETKKITRSEFLREVQIDPSEITSLIDSDYLKSYIDGEYIKSHANEDYVKSLVDQDYVLSFVDSDYVALKTPPIPDFGLMEFTAGQNILAGDVLVMNSEGKVVRSTSSGPAINSVNPIDLSTVTDIPHSVNYYNKFDGLVLYQSGYELYAAKVDSDNSMLVGQPVSTPFSEGVISVSTDNKNGNHFVCFGPRATAVGGYIDSDLSIHFTNTVSLNSYQNVDNWGGDYNYSVYDENENKYIWFSPGGGGDAYKPYQAVVTVNDVTSQIVAVEATSGWDTNELQTTTNQIDPIFLPENGIYVAFATDAAENSLKVYAGKINSETKLIEKSNNAVSLFSSSASLKSLGAFRIGETNNQFIVYGNQTHFVNEEGYDDYNNDFFYQIVTVKDLNTLIVGERHSIYLPNSFSSTTMGMAYDENDNSILVFWRSGYNQWERQLGIIRDGLIEFSNSSSFQSVDYGMAFVSFSNADKFPDFIYHELTRKIITSTIVYGNDLFSFVYNNSDFRTTNNDFIGIANENIPLNLTGEVVVARGISDKVGGLVSGSSVYLDMTGNLTSNITRYGVVGRALDSDRVLITRAHSETLQSQADVLISDLRSNQSLVYDGSKWVNKNFNEIDGLSVDSDAVQKIVKSTVNSSYLAENLPEIGAGSAVFLASENLTAGDLLVLNEDNTVSRPSSDGSIVANAATDISISSILSQPEIFRNLGNGDFITTYTTRISAGDGYLNERYLIIGSISPEGDISFGISFKYEQNLTDIVTDGENIILISVSYNDGVYASLLSRSGNSITEITSTVKLVSLTNTITNQEYYKPKPKAGYNTDNNTFALFCNDEPIKFQLVNGSIVVPLSFANRSINGWVSNGGEVKYIPAYGFYVSITANNVAGNNQLDIKVFDDRGLSIEKQNELSINHGSYRISSLGSSPYFSINLDTGNWYFYKISASGEIALLKNGGNAYGLDNVGYSMFAYDEVEQNFIQKDYIQINLGFNEDPPVFPPGASGGVNQLYRKFIISDNEIQYDEFPTYIPGQRLGLFEYTPTFKLYIEGDYQTLNTIDASSQTNVEKFIGFATESIFVNQFGSVTLLGGINDNFSGLIPGPYYTDFFGNVTKTPTEYGIVGVAISTTTMLVNRPLNFALRELDEVSINNAKLTSGQVLTYSGENWSNIDLPKILTKTEIFDLIDVNYVKARINQINISELQNVSSVAPNLEQVLAWDGSEWTPKTILDSADIERMTLDSSEVKEVIDAQYLKETVPPIETLNDIDDVSINHSSLSSGQVLTYIGNNWTNLNPLTEAEIIDIVDRFSLDIDEAIELIDSDYIIERMLPTVETTVDSDYVIGKMLPAVISTIDTNYVVEKVLPTVELTVDSDYVIGRMLPTVISTVDSDYVGIRAESKIISTIDSDYVIEKMLPTVISTVDSDYVIEKILPTVELTVDSDYVIGKMLPTVVSTVDSDYVNARLNLDELVSSIVLGGGSNQENNDGTFVGSINTIIDDRVTESYLSTSVHSLVDGSYLTPFIDSNVRSIVDRNFLLPHIDDEVRKIVNSGYFSPIIDSDYIADRIDLNRFFEFTADSQGNTSLTLSEESTIRNITQTVDSDYVIGKMLPTVVLTVDSDYVIGKVLPTVTSTIDSDYINSRITLNELFSAVTGNSNDNNDDQSEGDAFLSGIKGIIDEQITAEYIAERFSVATFIASVPDLPVDTDPLSN